MYSVLSQRSTFRPTCASNERRAAAHIQRHACTWHTDVRDLGSHLYARIPTIGWYLAVGSLSINQWCLLNACGLPFLTPLHISPLTPLTFPLEVCADSVGVPRVFSPTSRTPFPSSLARPSSFPLPSHSPPSMPWRTNTADNTLYVHTAHKIQASRTFAAISVRLREGHCQWT